MPKISFEKRCWRRSETETSGRSSLAAVLPGQIIEEARVDRLQGSGNPRIIDLRVAKQVLVQVGVAEQGGGQRKVLQAKAAVEGLQDRDVGPRFRNHSQGPRHRMQPASIPIRMGFREEQGNFLRGRGLEKFGQVLGVGFAD